MTTKEIYNYTEGDKMRFTELMKRGRLLVYKAINKAYWIQECDKDDFFQEIISYAWENFHKFDADRAPFSVWIYKIATWLIITFSKRAWRREGRFICTEDFSHYAGIEDEPYEEPHISSLHCAIRDLPVRERETVQKLLDGENLKELAVSEGKTDHYYFRIMKRVRKWILTHRDRYFEDIHVNSRKLIVVSNGRRNELAWNARPVEMRSMDGVLLKVFPSSQEAERNGFSAGSVSAVCCGRKVSHRGYRWNYVGETSTEIIHRQARKSGRPERQVVRMTLDGQIVKKYDRIVDAKEDGFTTTCIHNVLKGKQTHHKGYKWQHAN